MADDSFEAYKGYTLDFETCPETDTLHGRIGNIKDVVTCHGHSREDLYDAFKEAVDDYLETCLENDETPDAPCCGCFSIRTTPDIHRQCLLAARAEGESLETWAAAVLAAAAESAIASRGKG